MLWLSAESSSVLSSDAAPADIWCVSSLGSPLSPHFMTNGGVLSRLTVGVMLVGSSVGRCGFPSLGLMDRNANLLYMCK